MVAVKGGVSFLPHQQGAAEPGPAHSQSIVDPSRAAQQASEGGLAVVARCCSIKRKGARCWLSLICRRLRGPAAGGKGAPTTAHPSLLTC